MQTRAVNNAPPQITADQSVTAPNCKSQQVKWSAHHATVKYMIQDAAHLPSPHDFGGQSIQCGDCETLHFKDECVHAAELYYVCCADNKMQLPSPLPLPPYLYSLFTAATPEVRHF